MPRRVVHVDALPRESTGKLSAAALRQFALSTLAEGGADARFSIAADHPSFAGHFPGHPVLPGAALLSLVLQALAARPALAQRVGATPCIDHAKFLHPVGPGSVLQIALREQGHGVAFDVRIGSTTVARGQLSAAAA